ncbi:MAG: response regulator [Bdellovibrionales bacterium]
MHKILLIEDDDEISKMLTYFLGRHSFEITHKSDGKKAIQALQDNVNFDLILSDLLMPESDGFDVLFYLKKNNINIPTIIISGGGVTVNPTQTLESVETLATLTIPKPLDLDQLLSSIKQLLNI